MTEQLITAKISSNALK